MAHPITEQLERLDPPLAPDVGVEIYVSGVHKPGPDGYLIHAFGLVFHLSDGRKVKPVCSVSRGHKTTNDRAELGATLTALEWLGLNAGKTNPATLLSAQEYIYRHLPQQIEKWVSSKDAKNPDLLKLIFSQFVAWPDLRWERAKVGSHADLHEEAKRMANKAIDVIRAGAEGSSSGDDFVDDAFVTVDDEFWMERAIDRDRS